MKVIEATKVNLWKSDCRNRVLPVQLRTSLQDLKALDYATQFTTIAPQDRRIIKHAKKSLLYHLSFRSSREESVCAVTMVWPLVVKLKQIEKTK